MNPTFKPLALVKNLMVLLAVAAVGINIFLLTRTLGDAAIAGCGGGPCDEVLASRWSSLLGLPIPAFGILVYLLLLLSFFRRLEILRLPLLGGIAGAAFWFIVVQAFILQRQTPQTAHPRQTHPPRPAIRRRRLPARHETGTRLLTWRGFPSAMPDLASLSVLRLFPLGSSLWEAYKNS